jgi:predicted phosphodiesterase
VRIAALDSMFGHTHMRLDRRLAKMLVVSAGSVGMSFGGRVLKLQA